MPGKKRSSVGPNKVVYKAGDKREGFVTSSKNGNAINTYLSSGAKNTKSGSRKVTTKTTTMGANGRRENTVTKTFRKNTITGERGKPTVTEVQHNRGSGTRKTGAKKKAY
jgi:hypothetical protein